MSQTAAFRNSKRRGMTTVSAGGGAPTALLWLLAYAAALGAYAAWFLAPLWLSLPLCWVVPPLVYYLFTPLGSRLHLWRYLSGYLVLYRSGGAYALHLGTSYDALWRLRPCRRPGERLFTTMHRELYQGLHHFCELVRQGELPGDAVITAGSYFLTPKQMARYGFKETPVSGAKRLTFLFGYPEVLLQQLLITGRLRFYNPLAVRCYQSTAAEVAQRSSYFARLAARSGAEPITE
ncbi:MAG: hypothetical protein K0Q72_2812 [Armatimonadetes bacterium]|nr:hypothetical protein [Armatimonadota bacterium]